MLPLLLDSSISLRLRLAPLEGVVLCWRWMGCEVVGMLAMCL